MKRTIEMLPEVCRVRRAVGRRAALWGVLLGALTVGAVAASIPPRHRASELQRDLDSIRSQIQAMEVWAAQVAPLADRLASLHMHQSEIQQLIEEPAWSIVTSELAAAAVGVQFTSLKIEREAPAAGADSWGRMRLEIEGNAASHEAVIGLHRRLAAMAWLERVDLDYASSSGSGGPARSLEFLIRGQVR